MENVEKNPNTNGLIQKLRKGYKWIIYADFENEEKLYNLIDKLEVVIFNI